MSNSRLKTVKLDVSTTELLAMTLRYYFAPDRGAEYCDDRVCLCVCLYEFVCFSVREHISETARPIFISFFSRMQPMAVARSSCDGVAIRYVLPVYG